jgi:opacity protein-like surface antigen
MSGTIRVGFCAAILFSVASMAHAQTGRPERPWSVDFGIGWDNGISGNINSSAIGTLNGQAVVILKNKYEDVYGTGLHLRFGGGYLLSEESELRVTFTFQSLDADLTRLGDLGVSNLYAQYDDYQSFGIDVGYRRYIPVQGAISAYGEGTIGLAFIEETDVRLAAPQANFEGNATDFYDQTAAFTFGVNGGLMIAATPKVSIFTQLGLRYVSGMSDVDGLESTDLDEINDKSSRWAMPFTAGVRFRF